MSEDHEQDIACKCERIQLMQNGCCRAAIQRKGRRSSSFSKPESGRVRYGVN